MEDRKLTALKDYIEVALQSPNEQMWFMLPGGVLVGTPVTIEEYYKIASPTDYKSDDSKPADQERFFYLKDVNIQNGTISMNLNAAILDGTQVSAWGIAKFKRVEPIS